MHTHPATNNSVKPPPIYLHGNIDHTKLLQALKSSYDNRFHIKYASSKIVIRFQSLPDFSHFKDVCRKEGIQFHTFSLPTEKTLTVVPKGLIKLHDKIILDNMNSQGLHSITCTELPTHTKYPIYRITFVPGTTIAKVNQVRFIENIKSLLGKLQVAKALHTVLSMSGPRTYVHKL